MLRKIISTVILFPLVALGLSPSSAQAGAQSFVDVPPGTMFYDEIEWVAANGVSTRWEVAPGVREYRPVSPINRDAMAALLYRLAGSPEFTPTGQSFVGVPPGTQLYREIEWLAAEGISTGWTVGSTREFRPVQPINRDAMAAFLYRFAGDLPPRSRSVRCSRTLHPAPSSTLR